MKLLIPLLLVTSSANAEMVKGYLRKDGTYVPPYVRTEADNQTYNNYSYQPSENPKWKFEGPDPYDYVDSRPQPKATDFPKWKSGLD